MSFEQPESNQETPENMANDAIMRIHSANLNNFVLKPNAREQIAGNGVIVQDLEVAITKLREAHDRMKKEAIERHLGSQ